MKWTVSMNGFGVVVVLLTAWLPVWPQDLSADKKAKPSPIDGVWTWVSWENQGRVVSFLPRRPPAVGLGMVETGPYLWMISKNEIQCGPDDGGFIPLQRYTFELNPGNKEGLIDLVSYSKNGQKVVETKLPAIYALIDDYLLICMSEETRPESFSTSGKPATRNLVVLRRGKLN